MLVHLTYRVEIDLYFLEVRASKSGLLFLALLSYKLAQILVLTHLRLIPNECLTRPLKTALETDSRTLRGRNDQI